jgi:hypothetical protein
LVYMHDMMYTLYNNLCSHKAGVPYDGVPTRRLVTVKVPLAVFYIILGVVGIIFAVGCLCFNFIYRQNPLVNQSMLINDYTVKPLYSGHPWDSPD